MEKQANQQTSQISSEYQLDDFPVTSLTSINPIASKNRTYGRLKLAPEALEVHQTDGDKLSRILLNLRTPAKYTR